MFRTRVPAVRRCGVVAAVAAAALLAGGPAYAHVTVDPSKAEQGGYATLTFRVPNESEQAGTVEVTVKLPRDTPISSVRTKPKPGWTAEVDSRKLDEPVDIGPVDVSEAVTSITWRADKGVRVGPGEFEEFRISAGPLPSTTDALEFPATQTYDDGEVVKWNQSVSEGGPEPEHPAPTLTLTPGTGGHGGSASETSAGDGASDASGAGASAGSGSGDSEGSSGASVDATARTLGGVGIGVGALGVLVGAGAVLAARRGPRAPRPVPSTETKE